MDLLLLWKLIIGAFSLKKGNRRKPTPKRIGVILFMFPFFTVLFLVSRFFMLLDFIFFPMFLRQKVNRPVFIIAMPRSGTTFLFHALAESREFSSFRLWELIFAPSITQKYLLFGFYYLDKVLFHPVLRLVRFIEKKGAKKFRSIHFTQMDKPEEDDLLHLWNFSTLYFNFFHPDNEYFTEYFDLDAKMPTSKRKRVMRYYKRCVQRHEFVFNRKQEKIFLSKNPAMVPKALAVKETFPGAKVLCTKRDELKVIASTLGMNEYLYGLFTSGKSSNKLIHRTIELMTDWTIICNDHLGSIYGKNILEIPFEELTSALKQTHVDSLIAVFLGIENGNWITKLVEKKISKEHSSKNDHYTLSVDQVAFIWKKLDKQYQLSA